MSNLTEEQQADVEEMHERITEYIFTQAHEWFHVKHPELRLEWTIDITAKPEEEVHDAH